MLQIKATGSYFMIILAISEILSIKKTFLYTYINRNTFTVLYLFKRSQYINASEPRIKKQNKITCNATQVSRHYNNGYYITVTRGTFRIINKIIYN